MKILFIPALCLIITGCANTKDFIEYNQLLTRFTYLHVEVPGATVAEQHTHIQTDPVKPLIGDCDDFAFTLKSRIGGEVWYTFVNGVPHAVLIKDGIAFDFLMKPTRNYPYRLLFVIKD